MIGINGIHVDAGRFPDGTPNIVFPSEASRSIVEKGMARITWKFDGMEELFTLQCLKEKIDSMTDRIELELPYIPNARMDRVKNPENVFTLRTFCRIINAMEFSKVMVNNAHSNVSLALLDRVTDTVEESLSGFLGKEGSGFDTVMFPDEGAQKRYGDMDCIKRFAVVTGMKKRDWKTGQILGLEILGNAEDVKGRRILIIDDICSRGGTFRFSALKLREMGASDIKLFISHCENVVDTKSLMEAGITRVFTTDSIFRGSDALIKTI